MSHYSTIETRMRVTEVQEVLSLSDSLSRTHTQESIREEQMPLFRSRLVGCCVFLLLFLLILD